MSDKRLRRRVPRPTEEEGERLFKRYITSDLTQKELAEESGYPLWLVAMYICHYRDVLGLRYVMSPRMKRLAVEKMK